MYIDIHTHAFHPKIAHKAVDHLNDFYSVNCAGDGTIAHLLERERNGRNGKVRGFVRCHSTGPGYSCKQLCHHLAKRARDRVIAFGTVHPGYEDWESELKRIKAAGIRGIKLHPDFQSFWLDDPRLLPIFEAAQKDFVFEIHIGDKTTPAQNPSCPYKLAAILRQFPGMRVIAGAFWRLPHVGACA